MFQMVRGRGEFLVQLDDSLVAELDELSAKLGRSRSAYRAASDLCPHARCGYPGADIRDVRADPSHDSRVLLRGGDWLRTSDDRSAACTDDLVRRRQTHPLGSTALTAMSRSNLALVLAVLGLGLRRPRTWWRLVATLGVITWFAVVTRPEPQVLRASCVLRSPRRASRWDASVRRCVCCSSPSRSSSFVHPLLVWSVVF